MNKARKNPLTTEEIIASLKKSSIATILVEGKDDINIYRKLEEKIGAVNVSFLECGGRNTLLKIFEQKEAFKNKKTLFIADKDMWVLASVPEKYNDVFFTNGYSIENDLFEDGKSFLIQLFSHEENQRFQLIINELIYWFAYEVNKWKIEESDNTKFAQESLLSRRNFDRVANKFTDSFIEKRGIENSENATVKEIKANYIQKLRGKFIFDTLLLLFQERKKGTVTYSKKQLFDLCFTEGTRDSEKQTNMNKLLRKLQNFSKNN